MKKKELEKNDWNSWANELESEKIKLMSFDNTLIAQLGDLKNKKILDYGSGTGVFAKTLKDFGAEVKAFDISDEMLHLSSEKIGNQNIFSDIDEIPENYFDIVNCSLVVCIVSEEEVARICKAINKFLNKNGFAYVGFCNPLIYQVKESQLDFRFPTGEKYECIHTYKKVKKEGNYELFERHRPIEWYQNIFTQNNLKLDDTFFTPEYELNGNKMSDFIVFKLGKV